VRARSQRVTGAGRCVRCQSELPAYCLTGVWHPVAESCLAKDYTLDPAEVNTRRITESCGDFRFWMCLEKQRATPRRSCQAWACGKARSGFPSSAGAERHVHPAFARTVDS
jgi:hypothetical protein